MKRSDLKNWNNEKYWIEYDTSIRTILNRIYSKEVSKELIIPEYQRDYVWKEKNAPELLYSLYMGFPIGNIILWDHKYNGDSSYSLIDGLQRYLTITKLWEKEFNYVSFKIYKEWLKKKKLILFQISDEKLNEKEAFRHFKSSMHHKNKRYKPSNIDDALNFINSTNAKPFLNKNIKNRLIDFVKDFDKWHKREFKEINIPHYILDNMNPDEVAKVFELININGVKLSRFEIASANWSKNRIHISSDHKFINDFVDGRRDKYLKNFVNGENIGKHLTVYNKEEIIPSNFLYALFYDTFKEDNELRHSFIDNKNDFSLISKSIEPLCEVVIHILIKKFNVDEGEINFDSLGEVLSNKIKSKEDIDKLKKEFKSAFTKVKSSIPIIKSARINGKNKFPSYPVWLLSIFAIYIINGINKSFFVKWFVNELLFSTRLNSSTGKKAKEIITRREFEKDISKDVINEKLKELINSDDFKSDSYFSRNKSIILSLLQKNKRDGASDEQIDHFLPRTKLKKYVNYIDDVMNLQFKESNSNNNKSDVLEVEQYKHDVFFEYYSDEDKTRFKEKSLKLITEINKDKVDEKIVDSLYNELIDIRKQIIFDKIINSMWN